MCIANTKKEKLIERLKEYSSLLVAFSGGVDSSFLLALAHEVLGNNVVAVTAASIIHPAREREKAVNFTRKRGIRHIIFQSDEIDLPGFASNPPDRCYHCKKYLFTRLSDIAGEGGIEYIAHAVNLDDLGDYRPGIKAGEEAGILSPLMDVKLGKEEIRFLSRQMGLAAWDKPSMACLATRVPYGSLITLEKLNMVERAEGFLEENGFKQFRVRHHGSLARIEVMPSEIGKAVEQGLRMKILEKFREIGFVHISIDLEGYVTGSMNMDLLKDGADES